MDFRKEIYIHEATLKKLRKKVPDEKGNYITKKVKVCMDSDGKKALNYQIKDGKCVKMSPSDILKGKKTSKKRLKTMKKTASKQKIRQEKLAKKRARLGLDESTTIGLGTLFFGYKEDYTIVFIDSLYEVHDKYGSYIEFDSDDEHWDDFDKIFRQSKKISYSEYIEEYGEKHDKLYSKNDWDADYIIINDKGIKNLIKIIEKRFLIGR